MIAYPHEIIQGLQKINVDKLHMVLQVWLYVNKIIPHPHVGGVMFDNCVVGQKSVTAPPQWYEHRHVTKYDTMTSSSTQPTPHHTLLFLTHCFKDRQW